MRHVEAVDGWMKILTLTWEEIETCARCNLNRLCWRRIMILCASRIFQFYFETSPKNLHLFIKRELKYFKGVKKFPWRIPVMLLPTIFTRIDLKNTRENFYRSKQRARKKKPWNYVKRQQAAAKKFRYDLTDCVTPKIWHRRWRQ